MWIHKWGVSHALEGRLPRLPAFNLLSRRERHDFAVSLSERPRGVAQLSQSSVCARQGVPDERGSLCGNSKPTAEMAVRWRPDASDPRPWNEAPPRPSSGPRIFVPLELTVPKIRGRQRGGPQVSAPGGR